MDQSLIQRVYSQSNINKELPKTNGEHCIEFTGTLNNRGYGQIYTTENVKLPHRLAYEWFCGPIPQGKQVDHICNNRKCMNVNHLQILTQKENIARKDHSKRKKTVRLTDREVWEIRYIYNKEHRQSLAKKYNVSIQSIFNVLGGKVKKHVTSTSFEQ